MGSDVTPPKSSSGLIQTEIACCFEERSHWLDCRLAQWPPGSATASFEERIASGLNIDWVSGRLVQPHAFWESP